MIALNNLACTKCNLCQTRNKVVNGTGNLNAKIVLVGEGPGAREDQLGSPFVGPAGLELNKILAAAGLSRDELFCTNTIRCIPKAPPPDNIREPEQEEIDACAEYLGAEINAIRPNLIVPLGNTALRAVMGNKKLNISKCRGMELWSERFNCKVLSSYHPAAILRQPKLESITIQDFRRVKTSGETKELAKKTLGNYIVVDNFELLNSTIERLLSVPTFSVDIETSGFNWKKDHLLCVAFSWKAGTGVTIPITRYHGREEEYTEIVQKKIRKKVNGVWETIGIKEIPQTKIRIIDEYYPYWGENQALVLEKLKKVFSSDSRKILQNGKFDLKFLIVNGLLVNNFYFDTFLSHFLIDENAEGMHGLKDLAWCYTEMGGYEKPLDDWFKERGITEEKRNYAQLPVDLLYPYNAADADVTFRLYEIFEPMLEKDQLTELFHRLIMPLSTTLLKVEMDGTQIDVNYLGQLKKELSEEIDKLEANIKQQVGNVNIRSTKQLRTLLFDTLKLPTFKFTKTGASTDEEVLNELKKLHPIPKLILDHRTLAKLLSNYIAGIESGLDEINRIHGTFLITGTVTGRLSSRDPALQTIPRDDKRIKRLFIARPGWVLLEADYAQVEFRIWAHYSQDERMLADLQSGLDIHKLTASEVFNIPIDQVTIAQRQQAKNVVFGLMFGRGVYSLAEEFGLSEFEAQKIIDVFFGKYPKAQLWIQNTKRRTRVEKQVRNVFGRLRRLPGIDSQEKKIKSEAERQCINSPIQSGASDMNCNAATRIRLRFERENLHGVLCILVHDSQLYEIPENEFQVSLNIIREELERPVQNIKVPMIAELKTGKSWGELEKIKGDLVVTR